VLDEVSHIEANGILTGEESLLVMIVSSPKCRSGILKELLKSVLPSFTDVKEGRRLADSEFVMKTVRRKY
jgi:hypothetical protein